MKYYAGLDLGGTFIKCGIIDSDGRLLVKDKIPTGSERPYGEIAADMAKLALSLAERAGVTLTAAGVGAPGTIDSKNGVVVYSNNIKWEKVPLGRALEEKLKLPVAITNDANAAALGESYAGAGKNCLNMVMLTLGTGVGGGMVLNGRLFEGGHSAGAELGHMLLKYNGERCTCGRRGCLEAYASATALISQTKRAMKKNTDSAMWNICGGDIEKVDGKTAFDGMRAGDKTAKKAVKDYINYLAQGIINVCNVIRPDAVVLGGGVCAEGDYLLKPLRRIVKKSVFGGMGYAPVKIITAELGNDAGIYGAAKLVM